MGTHTATLLTNMRPTPMMIPSTTSQLTTLNLSAISTLTNTPKMATTWVTTTVWNTATTCSAPSTVIDHHLSTALELAATATNTEQRTRKEWKKNFCSCVLTLRNLYFKLKKLFAFARIQINVPGLR